MATRVLGPKGSKKRRRFLIVPILLIAGLALFWIGSASPSVHDIAVFQLDGNATVTDMGPLNYPGDDWSQICTTAAPNVNSTGCTGPNGGDSAHRVGGGFDYDQHAASGNIAACPTTPTVYAPGNNCTTFTGGGSKDDGDINGWAWNDGSGGLPDKDNLEQGFSARYTYTTTLTAAVPASVGTCDPTAPTTITIDHTLASWFSLNQQNFQFNNNKDYHLTIGNEIMLVTGGQNTDTLNVLRCQQGSTDGAHAVGDTVTVSLLNFGATRFDNSGDAQIGIWFFQNNVALGTNKVGGGTGFSGVHKNGDILVLSTFTGGGTTPTIQVWKWVAGQGNNGNTNLQLLSPLAGASCIPVPADGITEVSTTSPFCAAVNPADGTDSPWTFTNKRGRSTFDAGEFYEGGLNISAFPQLANECFGSFEIETRSSQSTSAVLKDFLLGPLQHCVANITTAPSTNSLVLDGSGTQTVTDTAVVDGVGTVTPTGKVQFFFCTPSQLTPANTGTCSSGGTQVIKQGSDATGEPLTQTTPGHASVTSGASPAITAVGKYCWRGVYQPAANSPYSSVSDSSSGECLTVTDTSSAATHQIWLPNDSATITSTGGTALNGTVSFTLYSGNNCGATSGSKLYPTSSNSQDFTLTNAASPASAGPTTNTAVKVEADATVSWKVTFTSSNSNVASPSTFTCEVSALDLTPNQ